jgi:restriction system protein
MSQDTVASNRCFLVRTDREFVEKGVIAVGWSKVNFANFTNTNELIAAVDAVSPIGRRANQIRRFVGMKAGDIVVVPLTKTIAVGVVTDGGVVYSDVDKSKGKANQRNVKFLQDSNNKLVTVPRALLTEGLQRRLRVQGITVNDISVFQDELEKAISDIESGKVFSLSNRADEKISEIKTHFRKELLSNIKNGNSNLKAGGTGLELLVKELLEIDGYDTKIFSKRAFKGHADADISASKEEWGSSIKLLIQVKHHHGTAGSWGVEQLKEIKRQAVEKYADHQLVLVTSAHVKPELRTDAEGYDIEIIDGEALVEMITDKIDHLTHDTKLKLGICQVPSIVKYL